MSNMQGGGGNSGAPDERTAKVILEADTKKYTEGIEKADKDTAKLSESVLKLATSFDGMYKKVGKKLIIFGSADLAIMTGMVAVAAKLDGQLSSLSASAAAVDKSWNTDKMRDSVKQISREVPVARGQIASLAASMRHMGQESEKSVSAMTASFTKLGGATGGDAGSLAQGQIQLSRTMGNTMPGTVDKMNDSLTSVSAAAGVDPQSVIGSAQQMAGVGKSAGMSQQDITGMAAAFQKAGPQGSQAQAALMGLTDELMKYQRNGDPKIKKFSSALGLSPDAVLKMDPKKLAEHITKATVGKGHEGARVFGRLGLDGQSTQQAFEAVDAVGGLDKYKGISKDAYGSGSTEEAAEAAWDTLGASMSKLKNNMTDMAQSIGQGVLPWFKLLADALSSFMTAFTPISRIFLEPLGKIATALGGLATTLGGFMGLVTTMGAPLMIRRAMQRPANMLARMAGGSGEGGVGGLARTVTKRGLGGVAKVADSVRDSSNKYVRNASIDDETIRAEKKETKAARKAWNKQEKATKKSEKKAGRKYERQPFKEPKTPWRERPGRFARDAGRQFNLGRTGGLSATLSGLPEDSDARREAQAQPNLRQRGASKVRGAWDRVRYGTAGAADKAKKMAEETASKAKKMAEEATDKVKGAQGPQARPHGGAAWQTAPPPTTAPTATPTAPTPGMPPPTGTPTAAPPPAPTTFEERMAAGSKPKPGAMPPPTGRPTFIPTGGGSMPPPTGPPTPGAPPVSGMPPPKGPPIATESVKKTNTVWKKFTGRVKESTSSLKQSIKARTAAAGATNKNSAAQTKSTATKTASDTKETTVKMALVKTTGSVVTAFGSLIAATARATAVAGAGAVGAGVGAMGSAAKGLGGAALGMVGGPWVAGAMAVGGAAYLVKNNIDTANENKKGDTEEQRAFRNTTNTYATAVGEASREVSRFGSSLDVVNKDVKSFSSVLSDATNHVGIGKDNEEFTAPGAEFITDKESALKYLKNRQTERQMTPDMTNAVLEDIGKNENISQSDMDWIKDQYSNQTSDGQTLVAPDVQGNAEELGNVDANTWYTSPERRGETFESLDDTRAMEYSGWNPLTWGAIVESNITSNDAGVKNAAAETATAIHTSSDISANTLTTGDDEKDKSIKDVATLSETSKALVTTLGNLGIKSRGKGQALVNAMGMGEDVNVAGTDYKEYRRLETDEEKATWIEHNLLQNTDAAQRTKDVDIDFKELGERAITALNQALMDAVEENGGDLDLAKVFTDKEGVIQEALTTGLLDPSKQSEAQQELYGQAMLTSGGSTTGAHVELQSYVNMGGPEAAIAKAAQAIGQTYRDQVERPQLNRVGQMKADVAEIDMIQQEPDKDNPDKVQRLLAAKQKLEAGVTGKYMEMLSYERNTEREKESFGISRGYQQEDFARSKQQAKVQYDESLQYGQEDYDRQTGRSNEDFDRSRARSSEDFQRSRKRSNADFLRSMFRGKKDYNKSRLRQDEDYYKQQERMAKDAAKTMYDPFKRVMAAQTADATTLVQNMKDQEQKLKDQLENIEKLKKMGLTQESIDLLDLTSPEKAQQAQRLVDTTSKGEVGEINKMTGERTKLSGQLVKKGESHRRGEEDREKGIKRGKEDFDKSRKRANADYNRSLGRGAEDFARTMKRGEKDFRRSLGRSLKDRVRMLKRQSKAHNRALRWQEEAFHRSIERADAARTLMLARMKEDFIGLGSETAKSIGEMAEETSNKYEEHFGAAGVRMAEGMDATVAEINKATRKLKDRTVKVTVETEAADTTGSETPGGGGTIDWLDTAKRFIKNHAVAAKDWVADKVSGGVDAVKGGIDAFKSRFGLAKGGIVTGPIDTTIGEAGDSEAVIPLNTRGAQFMADVLGHLPKASSQVGGTSQKAPVPNPETVKMTKKFNESVSKLADLNMKTAETTKTKRDEKASSRIRRDKDRKRKRERELTDALRERADGYMYPRADKDFRTQTKRKQRDIRMDPRHTRKDIEKRLSKEPKGQQWDFLASWRELNNLKTTASRTKEPKGQQWDFLASWRELNNLKTTASRTPKKYAPLAAAGKKYTSSDPNNPFESPHGRGAAVAPGQGKGAGSTRSGGETILERLRRTEGGVRSPFSLTPAMERAKAQRKAADEMKSKARKVAEEKKELQTRQHKDRPQTIRNITTNNHDKTVNKTYHSTNFTGEVHVESQNPDEMALKLKHKARLRSLRTGSRDFSASAV